MLSAWLIYARTSFVDNSTRSVVARWAHLVDGPFFFRYVRRVYIMPQLKQLLAVTPRRYHELRDGVIHGLTISRKICK